MPGIAGTGCSDVILFSDCSGYVIFCVLSQKVPCVNDDEQKMMQIALK